MSESKSGPGDFGCGLLILAICVGCLSSAVYGWMTLAVGLIFAGFISALINAAIKIASNAASKG